MPLSDITRSGIKSALEEFHRIGLDAMLDKYGGSLSTEWFVQVANWVYDPQLLLRGAHVSQGLGPLLPSGPESSASAESKRHLQKLGYPNVGRLEGNTSNLASPRATEPLMRWLVGAASNRKTLTYGEAAARLQRECGFTRVLPARIGVPGGEMQSRIRALDPEAPLLNVLLVRASGARDEIGMPGDGARELLLERFPDEDRLRNRNVRKEHPELWSRLARVVTEEVYNYHGWERLHSRLYRDYVPDPSYIPAVLGSGAGGSGQGGTRGTDNERATTAEELQMSGDVGVVEQDRHDDDHRKNISNTPGRTPPSAKMIGEFLRDHWPWVASLIYVYVTYVGMVQSYLYYGQHGINIFDFAELNDFLLAAFREPQSLIVLLLVLPLSVLYVGLLHVSFLYAHKFRQRRRHGSTHSPPFQRISVTTRTAFWVVPLLVALILPFFFSLDTIRSYPISDSGIIKNPRANFNVLFGTPKGPEPVGDWVDNLVFLGTTDKFVFFLCDAVLDSDQNRVYIAPVESIRLMERASQSAWPSKAAPVVKDGSKPNQRVKCDPPQVSLDLPN